MNLRIKRPVIVLKFNLLRHRLTVFVPKMSIGFCDQLPAILVSQPLCDGHVVDTVFNCIAAKEVPHVMMMEVW